MVVQSVLNTSTSGVFQCGDIPVPSTTTITERTEYSVQIITATITATITIISIIIITPYYYYPYFVIRQTHNCRLGDVSLLVPLMQGLANPHFHLFPHQTNESSDPLKRDAHYPEYQSANHSGPHPGRGCGDGCISTVITMYVK
jgi:hypothetical protein